VYGNSHTNSLTDKAVTCFWAYCCLIPFFQWIISVWYRKSPILSRWLSYAHVNSLFKEKVSLCPNQRTRFVSPPILFYSSLFFFYFVMNRQESEVVRRRKRPVLWRSLRGVLSRQFALTSNRTFVRFLKKSVDASSWVLFQYFAWGLQDVLLQENEANFCECPVQVFWCIYQMMKYEYVV
jgi:hypothetical protein